MKYYIRLDDASENMNIESWDRIEKILDEYEIKPLVGIIPCNKDSDLLGKYPTDPFFWEKACRWIKKGWVPALHGYDHNLCSKCRGINPINPNSEFAGVPLAEQKVKIRNGIAILRRYDIAPKIFFAPGHTYDMNTLTALKEESDIRIISDTMANDVYREHGFYFIPAQSGRPRKMYFSCSTICLHPNTMSETAFNELREFVKKNKDKIFSFDKITLKERSRSFYDRLLQNIYNFRRRKIQ